jgi:ribosomal protein S18 acetylase RimI-like enzyme
MRRGFDSPISEPGLPPGLRLVEWQAGRPEAIHAALNEAFQDHWGHVDQTYEQFLQNTSGSNLFHPELSFLVMDNEEIAGVSLNLVLDYDNQRTGIQEGWIGSLCVRRPWRNQGVASALLNASMRAFAASGYTCAGLTVDTENLTGALRIYERLGFIRVITTHTYMKQI